MPEVPTFYFSCKLMLIFLEGKKKKKGLGSNFAIMLIMHTYLISELHADLGINRSWTTVMNHVGEVNLDYFKISKEMNRHRKLYLMIYQISLKKTKCPTHRISEGVLSL